MTIELDVFKTLWADFVSGTIDPRFNTNKTWASVFFKNEVTSIKEFITLRFYEHQQNESNSIYYIRFVERNLLKLSAEILASPHPFYQLNGAIDDVIEFLINDFSQYFDYERPASPRIRKEVIETVKKQSKEIGKLLLNPDLDPLLVSSIKTYLDESDKHINTFQDLYYYKMFCEKVCSWLKVSAYKNLNVTLTQNLIYINFNSSAFFEYLRNKIAKKYPYALSLRDGASQSVNDLRDAQQIAEHNFYVYNGEAESAKAVLIKCIAAELEYIINLTKLSKLTAEAEEAAVRANQFLLVDLTVEQMAFLFRLFVDTKVIIVDNKSEFFNFLASRFRTKNKSTELSANSIKNKYNLDTDQTVAAVKKVLINFMNHVTKEYK